jgi:hypothetical protein
MMIVMEMRVFILTVCLQRDADSHALIRTHTHTYAHIRTHTQMSSTVVKQRIQIHIRGGPCAADYTGTVNAEGAPHGRGSYVIVEDDHKGDTYDGQFTHGLRHGVGKYTDSDGGWYAGEWKADRREGFGRSHVCVAFVCLALTVLVF